MTDMAVVNKFYIGEELGKCRNCGFRVLIRQPWLSDKPIANDGWYLIHCTNEACHNYYGMEIRGNELDYVDFIEDEVNDVSVNEYKTGKVIDLQKYVEEVRNGRSKNISW